MISSRDNPKLKTVRKLASTRQRDKLGLFVAEVVVGVGRWHGPAAGALAALLTGGGLVWAAWISERHRSRNVGRSCACSFRNRRSHVCSSARTLPATVRRSLLRPNSSVNRS